MPGVLFRLGVWQEIVYREKEGGYGAVSGMGF